MCICLSYSLCLQLDDILGIVTEINAETKRMMRTSSTINAGKDTTKGPKGLVVVGRRRVSLSIIPPCLAWEEKTTLKGRATLLLLDYFREIGPFPEWVCLRTVSKLGPLFKGVGLMRCLRTVSKLSPCLRGWEWWGTSLIINRRQRRNKGAKRPSCSRARPCEPLNNPTLLARPCEPLNNPTLLLSLGGGSHPSSIGLVF